MILLRLLLSLSTWLAQWRKQRGQATAEYARPVMCCGDEPRGERGQATAEYALILLGAAAVAMLLVSWVTKTNRISNLLDAVFRHITGLVS